MPSFFISHSSADAEEAAALCSRLETAGYPSPFVSSEPGHTIAAGREWERELYRQLQARDAVIFLGSEASVASKWCFAELAFARAFGKPVFPVMVDESAPRHSLLGDVQGIRLVPDRDAGYGRLLADLDVAGLAPGDVDTWDGGENPYPGLRSYAVEEAGIFFGRAREAADLENRLRLRPTSPAQAFLTVTGPSGCGKSSLVRAGLLPRLHRARAEWLVVDPFVPGARPADSLARAVTSTARRDGLEWAWRDVAADRLSDRLWDVVLARGLEEGEAKVLLVVDQLEELLRAEPDERRRFTETVQTTLAAGDLPLRVVSTLRSGSLGAAMAEPELVSLLQNQMVVGALGRGQLRDVIEGPARVAVIALAPGLTDRILDEAVGADVLPLLAFALRRLVAEASEPGSITIADYERIGGVIRALEQTADGVLAAVEEKFGREPVAAALMSIVTLDPAGEPTRQRVDLSGMDDAGRDILEHFVEARLLTVDEAVVEVAHEALFRAWRPLQLLIDEHRSELEMRGQLERAADDWQRADRRPSYALRGDRLAAAQSWSERHGVPTALRAFLDASMREDVGAREREADQLANRVLRDHRDDPERGVLLALAAIDTYACTPRTLLALSTALAGWRVERVLPTDDWVHVAAPSPVGSLVAALTSSQVLLFDLDTGDHSSLAHPARDGVMTSNQALAWTADGRHVVVGTRGAVLVWDVSDGRLVKTLETGDAQAVDVAMSADGAAFACAVDDGSVMRWRLDALDTPPERFQAHTWDARAVAFSPDDRRLATGGGDRRAVVWDLETAQEVWSIDDRDTVWGVAWSPTEPWLATISPEGGPRLHDVEARTQPIELDADGWGYGLSFGPQGQLASASRGNLVIWDDPVRTAEPLRLKGRSTGRNPRFTADGQRIVLDHERDGVWIWDARQPGPELSIGWEAEAACFAGSRVVTREREKIAVYDGATQVASWEAPSEFLPRMDATADGQLLVTDHGDGVRLWRLPDGELVRHIEGDRWPRFSADGELLLLYSREGQCEIWSVDPLARVRAFTVADDSVWTADVVLGGEQVVTCGRTGVSAWDVEDGSLALHICEDAEGDPHVAASPDGLTIAVCSARGEEDAGVWDVRSGELLRPLAWMKFNASSAYAPVPKSISFAPDGARIVTSSADGSVQIWDAVRGELVQLMMVADDGTLDAQFSPDGLHVVITQDVGPAQVWPAPPADELIRRARERSFRDLTDEERAEYGLHP